MNTRWPATVKDKKTTRQTSAVLPVAFFVEVQAAAAKAGMNMSQFIHQSLREKLGK